MAKTDRASMPCSRTALSATLQETDELHAPSVDDKQRKLTFITAAAEITIGWECGRMTFRL